MTCPVRTEVTDGICGVWTGQKGRGGVTLGWEWDGSGDEHDPRVEFGQGQDRGGKILVGRIHPEVGNERPQSSEGRERSLGLLRRDPGWGFTVTFSSQSAIHSRTCLGMSSLEATSCSPPLPPWPGLRQGSIYGEKRKETEANYFTNYLITLSTPSPPGLRSGAAAAAAPTRSLSWHISSPKALLPPARVRTS